MCRRTEPGLDHHVRIFQELARELLEFIETLVHVRGDCLRHHSADLVQARWRTAPPLSVRGCKTLQHRNELFHEVLRLEVNVDGQRLTTRGLRRMPGSRRKA